MIKFDKLTRDYGVYIDGRYVGSRATMREATALKAAEEAKQVT